MTQTDNTPCISNDTLTQTKLSINVIVYIIALISLLALIIASVLVCYGSIKKFCRARRSAQHSIVEQQEEERDSSPIQEQETIDLNITHEDF